MRRLVDDGAPPGRFLLTGSAAPVDAPTHSGAARIVRLRMRPLSLAERRLTAPVVGLGDLLSGRRPDVSGECPLGLPDYAEEIAALDPVPGWVPSFTPLARLAAAPKHHLADPGLAAHLLGLDPAGLLSGRRPRTARGEGPLLAQLFESLVTLSIRVYAQRHRASVSHLRTRDGGHEVDLIVERPDGGVLAVGARLAMTVDDSDVRHLLWLRDKLGGDLMDAVVVTSGPYAYRRPDGVAVLPAALLGP